MNLTTNIASLKLKNPVMTASGAFGYGTEYSPLIDISKLGAIITKTLTLEPRKGNPPPRIWELPYGMLNSIGLANIGVREFIDRQLEKVSRLGTAVIVNIAGKEAEDYPRLIEILDPHPGFNAYELNVSCPNVKKAGMLFGIDPEAVFDITRACSTAAKHPIIVKLTPNITDPTEVAKAAEEAGASALTIANTVLGMAVDIENRIPRLPFVTAGYSGPGMKPINLAKLYQVRRAVDIPLIGCGGIMDYRDALEYIITGATSVQIGSAVFKNPKVLLEVIEGIEGYMKEKGIEDISDLTGTLKTGVDL
ncbi:MAG: dihydroorotate dehydrogenase [candidate division Zixibacteria bacterium]|nr:dihydroorotate dehydrogenase [Candidatus Tariuqbacter arcticus]